jgi:hypothetical protein
MSHRPLFALFFLLVAGAAAFASWQGGKVAPSALSCSDGSSLATKFFDKSVQGTYQRLAIRVSKHGSDAYYELVPVEADGAGKFSTADGSVSLWEQAGELALRVGDGAVATCRRTTGGPPPGPTFGR